MLHPQPPELELLPVGFIVYPEDQRMTWADSIRFRPAAALLILGVLAVLAAPAPFPAAGAAEEAGDVVLFYPAYLTSDPRTGAWRGEIRGRVFERDLGLGSRVARAAFRGTLGFVADPTEEEEKIFDARAEPFVADAERGERVVVGLGGRSFVSHRSRKTGHFLVDVALAGGTADTTVPFRARLDREGSREFEGTLRLVPPEGVSVISDVDDTVKVSNVLDRGELVANTFLRPYRAVPGMPALYAAWGSGGVAIHYVTASPWQLFSPIWRFLVESGFPGVHIEMREVRLTDTSVADLFRDSQVYKKGRIREILRRFPGRQFVLVGDSGERDPEVYAAIARDHPASVKGIFIRAVRGDHLDRARYREIFAGIEESRWVVFADPSDLPRDLAGWIRSLR
jgi:phosphatidate phosphatase APP1